MDVVDGFAYLVDYSSIFIVDIRNPHKPELVGRCQVGSDNSGVAVRDGVAFIAAGINGLISVDVHDPQHPLPIVQFSTGTAADRISLAGNRAYISQLYEGFTVVDVRDPGAPSLVGQYTAGHADELRIVGGLGTSLDLKMYCKL